MKIYINTPVFTYSRKNLLSPGDFSQDPSLAEGLTEDFEVDVGGGGLADVVVRGAGVDARVVTVHILHQ